MNKETLQFPDIKMIKAKEINVDRRYQRGEKTDMIRKIIAEFDYHLVNPVKLVLGTDMKYYAWDGQQTTIGMRTKFGDDCPIPCMIYTDIESWEEAAELYEKANDKKFRKPVSSVEIWTSKLNRGEDFHKNIESIVKRNGFTLSSSAGGNKNFQIRALDALEAIYKQLGDEKTGEVLSIINLSWHGNVSSIQSVWLRGMASFVDIYDGRFKKERLVNQLSVQDPAEIKKEAQTLKKQNIRTKNDIAFKVAQIYNATKGISDSNKLDLSKVLK